MGNFAEGATIRNTYPAQAGADSRPEVGLSRGFTLRIRLRLRARALPVVTCVRAPSNPPP